MGLKAAAVEMTDLLTERFLSDRRVVSLTYEERSRLETAISEVKIASARTVIVKPGKRMETSNLLLDGFLARFLDDKNGLRQFVAFHVPGDFVDLHAYPMHMLDHGIVALTSARLAIFPHSELDRLNRGDEELTKKLWFSTLLDAAIHRTWVFRFGRLDGAGRVAHFFSETNARLHAAYLSDNHQFQLPITQADLGEICGLTSIHTNRVLRRLREEGLCTFREGTVTIPELSALERRGQFDRRYLYLNPDEQ